MKKVAEIFKENFNIGKVGNNPDEGTVKSVLMDVADDLARHHKMKFVRTFVTNSLSTLVVSKPTLDYNDLIYLGKNCRCEDIDIVVKGNTMEISIMYNNDELDSL